MTLTRPAYEITVANLDNVWDDTATAGDSADPEAGVWLADGLKLQWRFSEAPPSQLEPEVAQFAIVANGIANLPRFELGDRVTVTLVRPTLTDPITYMEFAGRVTDLDLVTDAAKDRVRLAITAVDPTSELTHAADFTGGSLEMDPTFYAWGGGVFGYEIAAYYLEIVTLVPEPHVRWWDAPTVAAPKQAMPIDEFIRKILPPTLMAPSGENSMAVQRYVLDELTPPEYQFFDPPGTEPIVWKYYLAQWRPDPAAGTLPTLFEYAFDPGDPDKVTVTPTSLTLPADPAVIPINARYVPNLAEWTKDRSSTPNRVTVTGNRWIDAQNIVEATPGVATDDASLARFGAITRTVETFAKDTALSALAAKYLSIAPANAADAWRFPRLTVMTDEMDDATLDVLAPMFWTPREPVPGVMGTPVLFYGVDPDIDPTDGYMFSHLAGVTFEASGGDLTITPELTPAPTPSLAGLDSDSPSYDEFGASAFGNATYHDQGGATDYFDPDITYDQAKLAAL